MPTYKVLLVDDSPFMRKVFSDFITADPSFEVAGTAANGMEAIERLQAIEPDVVTMDLEMPVMNGLEALKRIMAIRPTPVIMMSAVTDNGTRDTIRALQYGAIDFIRKPDGTVKLDILQVSEQLREKLRIAAETAASGNYRVLPDIEEEEEVDEENAGGADSPAADDGGQAAREAPQAEPQAEPERRPPPIAPPSSDPPASDLPASAPVPESSGKPGAAGRAASGSASPGRRPPISPAAGGPPRPAAEPARRRDPAPAEPRPKRAAPAAPPSPADKPPAASRPTAATRLRAAPPVGAAPPQPAVPRQAQRPAAPDEPAGGKAKPAAAATAFGHLVAIGTSTGGPRALHEVLTRLPADFPAPILVVQHMPPKFTQSLAQRLDSFSQIRVCEAQDGEAVQAGTAYIAPGGKHMTLVRGPASGYRIALSDDEPRSGHKPSVDRLFESLLGLRHLKRHVVLMTGMGSDGAKGMLALREDGAETLIAEAEQTCIVYGMPRSAIELGAASQVLRLQQIAPALVQEVSALNS